MFGVQDHASAKRSNGAILYMKPELGGNQQGNYIVLIWMIFFIWDLEFCIRPNRYY